MAEDTMEGAIMAGIILHSRTRKTILHTAEGRDQAILLQPGIEIWELSPEEVHIFQQEAPRA